MTDALTARIRELDNKQAVHYFNIVAGGAEDAPSNEDLAEQFDVRPEAAEIELEGSSVGQTARDALMALASDPEGTKIVETAMAQPKDETQDFGLISGGAMLVFAYIAVTSGIKLKIGGLEIVKEGIAGGDQTGIAKDLMAALIKALSGQVS